MSNKLKLTIKWSDLKKQYMAASSKGGQNANKNATGIRLTHVPSGVSVECRETKSRAQNEKLALRKLANNKMFRAWCGMQLQAQEEGFKNVEAKVDSLMESPNLKVERWINGR